MWLISPLSWLLLALLLAPLAWRARSRTQWPWRGCVMVAMIAVAAMTPLVANSLVRILEHPGPVAEECLRQPPSTIVVLAGGRDRPPRHAGDFEVLNLATRRRMDRALRHWREDRSRRLVLSGGARVDGGTSHAEMLRAYARWSGVPGAVMTTEDRSQNTWQNAWRVAGLAATDNTRRITLVTSALHMRRARLAFRAAGFEVCPLPTDSRFIPFGLPGYLIPQTSALAKTEWALHELVGLGYYLWLDWRHGAAEGASKERSRA